MPVYVAGFERREPRIADWSMTVTDGSLRGMQPWISELLPEPATPVTATRTPSGTSTEMSRRLWSRAFRIGMKPRAARGSGFRPCRTSRWRPVAVPAAMRPATVPSYTMVPPCGPAPGPMSTTWSATLITSGSCSTTRTVLPLSRRRRSRSFSWWTSWAWRPMVGSSKMYVASVRLEPRWRTILVRCVSPPDNVDVSRSRLR